MRAINGPLRARHRQAGTSSSLTLKGDDAKLNVSSIREHNRARDIYVLDHACTPPPIALINFIDNLKIACQWRTLCINVKSSELN